MNQQKYDNQCHRIGRISILLAFLGTVLFPVVVLFFFHVPADWAVILAAATSILAVQIPGAISQFLSYVPLMGPAPMYMMVVTGNFANMKIPAMVAAKEAVGMDASDQSEEADVIATLAMGTSTIVCEIILILGVLLMGQLGGLLANPVLKPAFANISPAVFGALFMVVVFKTPKLAVMPVLATILMIKFTPIPSALMLPIALVVALVSTKIMYQHGLVGPKQHKEE